MKHRFSPLSCGALLVCVLLVLTSCASVPDAAPDCHGDYTPINSPDHYLPGKKAP